ncbi:putative drug resistance transporter [Caenibius tardaugens NBRC 16725]|uniref:Putative drug resistance transporter n=1 Tax=Caenibius tardaugens NBRC 16725 TaxID=1219035 RepID=U3A778_9SPHN|nr:multidrug effflux MFS transporter [Caenibius tardaugens]GAD50603.1 putative drug resistance transporter [Caenibius tardaugens NBRC 16725]
MGEREFVVMMALFQALQALAIDAMLPALGIMSRDLGVADSNQRQLVVGVFLLCAGLGSLFPGAIADRYGRRPVLFTCLGGYIVFSLAAALMRDFTALLVMRGLAGFMSAGMLVMSTTIIRDRFQGDKMARTQSLVGMVFMIVPMIAPTLGQAVLLVADWRWIFGIMAGLGGMLAVWAALRLPETLHPEYRQTIAVRVIAANMRTALMTRAATGYVFGMALIQGALFGYINSSQQLVAEHFGAGESFPLIFGGMALMMALANLTNSRIVERFGARRVSHTALFGFMLLGAVQLWLALRGGETLWEFAPVMTLNLCLMGFIGANFGSIALQPFARIAGAAASLQTFLRLVIGSALGAFIGQLYDGSAVPLAAALMIAGILALLLVLFSERGRLFQRRHGVVPQV